MKCREAAYLALLKEDIYATDSLKKWREQCHPCSRDFSFAQELSFGTIRMSLALDYIARNLTEKKKLDLKLKEKVLLRLALYQYVYMDRVPLYAITNETMEIAKKYCHSTFVRFLNAILRKLPKEDCILPEDLHIHYSYPEYYVKLLIKDYGVEKARDLLELGNKPGCTMYRVRSTGKMEIMSEFLPEIAKSPAYYIQNATPAALVAKLCLALEKPSHIVDLCASPGGKLISIHDHFPEAILYANDVSEAKLLTLTENCEKYEIKPTLTCSKGEEYKSEQKMDVVILDVPCSNTGVLNKRAEARWRLSHQNMEELEKTQLALIENALTLLSNGGEIWYLTCSILKRENEYFIEKVCKQFNLSIRVMETILPNNEGWDGGFACALKKICI